MYFSIFNKLFTSHGEKFNNLIENILFADILNIWINKIKKI